LFTFLNLTKIEKKKKKKINKDKTKTKTKVKTKTKNIDKDIIEKGKYNILIVEDNKINQKLLVTILNKIGNFNIEIANDGLEGHKKVETKDFHVIFMDIDMPNMNGVEATIEIRKFEKEYKDIRIPIICLTANALSQNKEIFLSKGMDYYTTKPIDVEEVKEYLIEALNTSKDFDI
jgi:CheY-like chemotaxis protein